MDRLTALPNIGGKLSDQLTGIGINTFDQLKEAGSCNAWLQILAQDPSACYMRLCALEGAIQGVRWHDLPEETKASLKDFYQSAKKGR